MPVTNLFPTSDGGSWNLTAGADKISAVSTNDGDTSCIDSSTGALQSYGLADLPAEASSINSVTVVAVLRYINPGPVTMALGTSNGGLGSNFSITGAYTAYNVTAPAPGGGWTPTNVNAASLWIDWITGGTDARCTQCYLAVDWSPAAAGFQCFLGGT